LRVVGVFDVFLNAPRLDVRRGDELVLLDFHPSQTQLLAPAISIGTPADMLVRFTRCRRSITVLHFKLSRRSTMRVLLGSNSALRSIRKLA
jgi:hypothetical protein